MNLTQTIPKDSLPVWFVNSIMDPLESGASSVFIIHGDISCLVPNFDPATSSEKPYIKFREFWRKILSDENMVIFYNIASGISFLRPEMETEFKKAAELTEPAEPTDNPIAAARADLASQRELPTEPDVCLGLIEKVLRKETNVSVIVNSVHFIAPASGGGVSLSPSDRINIERLRNWSQSETVRTNKNMVILLTEQASKISPELRIGGNEIELVHIAKPTEDERRQFISLKTEGTPEQTEVITRKKILDTKLRKAVKASDRNYLIKEAEKLNRTIGNFPELYMVSDDLDANSFTIATQGLSLNQIQEILIQSKRTGIPLTLEIVKEKKYKLLSNEYSDVMEVVNASKGLEDIGGMQHLKDYFRAILKAIKSGDVRLVPMGITLMGPPGTGKTAFVEALAMEAGFHFIKIKNVRSMWVGESEARMEKLINGLWSLVPVVVMNDEADLGEANRDAPKGDSGVSERLMREWMTFLSNPKIRGKVIVINCTNRPDRMDAALKRSGRSDERILLPMPSLTEIPAIFEVMFKRYGIKTPITDFTKYAGLVDGYSGSDIEKISLSSLKFASVPGDESEVVVDDKALRKSISDFIPSASQADIDYMTLVGLLSSSSRKLLPPNIVPLLTDIKKRNLVANSGDIFKQIKDRRIVDLDIAA